MLGEIQVTTRGAGLYEVTREVAAWVSKAGQDGLLTLLIQHTSASLLIQENADPDVQRDMRAFFSRLVPHSNDPRMSYIVHTIEGPDDMPAHLKAAMLPVNLSIPVAQSRLVLGTWQGIFLFEHRDAPHNRRIAVHFRSD